MSNIISSYLLLTKFRLPPNLAFFDSHFLKPFSSFTYLITGDHSENKTFLFFELSWPCIAFASVSFSIEVYFIHSCSILPTRNKTYLLKCMSENWGKKWKVLIYHPAKTDNKYGIKLGNVSQRISPICQLYQLNLFIHVPPLIRTWISFTLLQMAVQKETFKQNI